MMKGVFLTLLLLGANAHMEKVSPVQKVIELLDNLKGKVAADLAAEEKEMEEYATYCDDTISEKGFAIRTATKAIERLQAAIEDGTSQVAAAETDISTFGSEIAKKETELAKTINLRKSGRAEFQQTEASLVKADDELHGAEVLIKQQGGASFVQVGGKKKPRNWKALAAALSKVIDSTVVMSSKAKAKLQGFMQSGDAASDKDDLSLTNPVAPEAAAYEGHSGGIVDTIKDLEVKDEDQLSNTRKAEMGEQHSFDMMKMSMDDAIALFKKKLAKATAAKAAVEEKVAASQAEMAETEKTKASDEAFVKGLHSDCASAAGNWDDRKKSAAEEQGAIDKAKEILSSGVKALVQVVMIQQKNTQPASAANKVDHQRAQIQKVLKNLGHKYNSFAMMELASAAAADPFGKVKGLIEDMISKLMEAAAQETDHKAFCDEELGKSRKSSVEKSTKMDQYRNRMDQASTTRAELEMAVKELESEIAQGDAENAAATKLRSAEHTTYLQASSDYKDSAEAVERAMTVLAQYYGTALVQVKKTTLAKKGGQPEFGSKTGSDTASTILAILEVSASDFTRLLAETESAEEEGQAAFEKLSKETKVSKAAKLAEVRGKNSEIKSLTVALGHHKEDYSSVSKEYGAVQDYLEKLKPECETKVMSYAEKKQRRENEIDGLKEALGIVEGTTVPSE